MSNQTKATQKRKASEVVENEPTAKLTTSENGQTLKVGSSTDNKPTPKSDANSANSNEILIIPSIVVAPVTMIPCSDTQRAQRMLLMRSRLYCETKIYLNNTNCKWIAVGVLPSQRATSGITSFETELYIGGDKCSSVAVGGVVGFLQLVRQLRTIGYWQNMFLEEKSTYSGNAMNDGFEIERMTSYDTPVYRINKKGTNAPVFMAFKTIEALLKSERAIISLATGKNPKTIFRNYVDVLTKMLNDDKYIVLSEKNKYNDSFSEESYANFGELIAYDIKQISVERNQTI